MAGTQSVGSWHECVAGGSVDNECVVGIGCREEEGITEIINSSLGVADCVEGGSVEGGSVDVDGGNVDGGNVDGGNVDGGNVDGGNVDGGNVDGGNVEDDVSVEDCCTVGE